MSLIPSPVQNPRETQEEDLDDYIEDFESLEEAKEPTRASIAVERTQDQDEEEKKEEAKHRSRISLRANLSDRRYSSTSDELENIGRNANRSNNLNSNRPMMRHRIRGNSSPRRSPRISGGRRPQRLEYSNPRFRPSHNMRAGLNNPFDRHLEERKYPIPSNNYRDRMRSNLDNIPLDNYLDRNSAFIQIPNRNRNQRMSPQEIDAYMRRMEDVEQDSELAIFNCNICFNRQCMEYQICRHCSGQACKTCWDGIMLRNSRCPFCRTFVSTSDLIKNRFADEVKEMLANPRRKKESSTYQCPVHKKKGSQFCETCSYFICIDCIKEGTHNGHDLCDIDDKPELKEKIEKIGKFHKEVEDTSKIFKDIDKEFTDYYNIKVEDMDWMAKRLKTKINNTIDSVFSKEKQEFEQAQNKFSEFKKDLDKLGQAQTDVFTIDHRKSEVDTLRENFKKALITSEAGEIVNIIANHDTPVRKNEVTVKYEMTEIPATRGAYKEKYLKSLLSEIKKIKEI
ncbi:unnamed protein product [Moneuplotes crassus]|uniref:RING-type domain-containing protein n=2 Tax=Euplotes crassus TaxID=5936 RepID=A0AAD1X6U5_EUPCR|nr:unnamed protein product [Moneuplotes crassus]